MSNKNLKATFKVQQLILLLIVGLTISSCGGKGSVSSPSKPSSPTIDNGTAIHDIQGSSDISPMLGQTVNFSAIVTGDFQDNDSNIENNLSGFYVQQTTPDNDPLTSEGIFIFDGATPSTDVNVGDRVQITGTVKEYYGETQIDLSSITLVGSGTYGEKITATEINLPSGSTILNSRGKEIASLEQYEGMLVKLPQRLKVSNLRYLDQYGEVLLSQGAIAQSFTNENSPSISGYAQHLTELASRSIILDDGLANSNPTTIKYLNAGVEVDFSIRVGDSITGLTGNLRFSKGSGGGGDENWRIESADEIIFANDNPRPTTPELSGNLKVASFNVLNFFTDIDSGQPICGPSSNQNCRGADSEQEFERQLQKTVTAINMMDADIVGLIELENNATQSISTIVNALNSRRGSEIYAYLNTGTIYTDAIKTGFIYKQETVKLKGDYAILTSSIDPRFNENKSRPTLLQSFELNSNGAVVSIALNHFKSKGSSCSSVDDPILNNGQGNCNLTRTNAANALVDWLATDPTSSGDPDFLIIGDLNAYLKEDPVTAIKSSGYTSLLKANQNPYSYSFNGQLGALDHALASDSLTPKITETLEWHINADEPKVLDYNLDYGRNADLFDGNIPYRSSDHDPIIIGINLVE